MELIFVLKLLLIFSAIAVVYSFSRLVYKPASRDALGWFQLKPGFLDYFALLGTGAFAILMWCIYLFVGSDRADATKQEFYMIALAVAFTISAAYVWWRSFAHHYSWQGDKFRVDRFGQLVDYDLSDLVDIRVLAWRGEVRLYFQDGKKVSFSESMHGVEEFGEHLEALFD